MNTKDTHRIPQPVQESKPSEPSQIPEPNTQSEIPDKSSFDPPPVPRRPNPPRST